MPEHRISGRYAHARTNACRCIIAALVVLSTLAGSPASAGDKNKAAGLQWLTYEKGLDAAKAAGRFVVIDFYTSWCRDCKKMDAETFSDPEVVRMVSDRFVAVKVDGDHRPELTSGFGVFAYPTVCILAPDGSRVHQRIGYMQAEEFKAMLEYASTGAYEKTSFNEYVRDRVKKD